jgi:hypothetical protein
MCALLVFCPISYFSSQLLVWIFLGLQSASPALDNLGLENTKNLMLILLTPFPCSPTTWLIAYCLLVEMAAAMNYFTIPVFT